MFRDDSVGLLLEQPRGACPSLRPPCSERGVRINMIQLRKQNTKRIIIEARENKGFVYTEEVLRPLPVDQ